MHEAASLLVGGTLTAADYVMTGKARHALNLGGGLHHGFRGRASGFCVYNDSSVVIRYLQKKYHAKVYILIRTPITATGCSLRSMMILPCVPSRFMKPAATFSRERGKYRKEVMAKATATL